MRATELVVLVRCLHCRHKSVLNHHMLAGFGFRPYQLLSSAAMHQMRQRQRHGEPGCAQRACRSRSNVWLGRGAARIVSRANTSRGRFRANAAQQ